MNSFVVHPDEGGPHPVVLFYMDAPGKREELHDMARRLAAVGYCVLLPNLYYRRTRDFYLKERTEAAMAEMFGLMNTLDARHHAHRHPGAAGLCRRAAGGRCHAHRRGGLLHERALRHVGGGGLPRAAGLHRVDPRCQHGHRQAGFTAPHGAADPLRKLLRLRRDRQVGAAGRYPGAAAIAAKRRARRTASSGTRAWSTASCSRSAPASTTAMRPSGTGSGCSACSRGGWGAARRRAPVRRCRFDAYAGTRQSPQRRIS